MAGKADAAGRPVHRLARRLIGRNTLRRTSDRIESAVVVLLAAAFVAAVAGSVLFGLHIYHSDRVAASRLDPTVAVLTQNGPYNDGLTGAGEAAARWRAPDGQLRSGLLNTVAAPGIWDARAGARVPVWLNDSGQLVNPPLAKTQVLFTAIIMAVAVGCGAGTVLLLCYWLLRVLIDRRRLAGWEQAWALTGPRWTSRR